MTNIGTILSGAFSVFTERLGAVVAWGATYLVASLAGAVLLAFAITGSVGLMTTPNPMAVTGGVIGAMILFYLAFLLLGAVIMNAVFRAILTPSDSRFAFLRLGGAEFRTLGLIILYAIGIFVVWFVGYLLVLLATMVVGVAAGSPTATIVVGALLFIAFLCFMIWIQVRLVPLFPLSFYRRRISVDGAWALTRGRFWTLFASYLVVAVPTVILIGILVWVLMGSYFAGLSAAAGDPAAMEAAQQSFAAEQAAKGVPAQLLTMLVSAVFSTAVTTLWVGISASATRALLDDRGDVSEEEVYRTAELFE